MLLGKIGKSNYEFRYNNLSVCLPVCPAICLSVYQSPWINSTPLDGFLWYLISEFFETLLKIYKFINILYFNVSIWQL